MKFVNVAAPVGAVWSSPFVRWQGSLADVSSVDRPTGTRAIAELVTELTRRGGGVGLFTGCAAGDTAGAVVLRVRD